MTRTDRIKAAVLDEIEQRRTELDAERGLMWVTFTVKIDCKSTRPFKVNFAKEAGRELAA